MATLNLEPAISTRYRIERVMYRGRCSIVYRNGLAHCSTANSARATVSCTGQLGGRFSVKKRCASRPAQWVRPSQWGEIIRHTPSHAASQQTRPTNQRTLLSDWLFGHFQHSAPKLRVLALTCT